MSVRKRLFSQRRWMFWLPLPATALMVAPGQFADFLPLLVGGLVFWIPCWLAWWLSDGFTTVSFYWDGGGSRMGGDAHRRGCFMNYATGHIQGYLGPSSYRI